MTNPGAQEDRNDAIWPSFAVPKMLDGFQADSELGFYVPQAKCQNAKHNVFRDEVDENPIRNSGY